VAATADRDDVARDTDPGPSELRSYVASSLLRGAVGFVIAVVAGAGVDEAATALAWGAVFFGFGLVVVSLLVSLVERWRHPAGRVESSKPSRWDRFIDSWRGDAVFVGALVFLAIVEDPETVAFFAGYGIGAALIAAPVWAMTAAAVGFARRGRSRSRR